MKNIHILRAYKEQHSIVRKHTGLLLIQTPRKEYSGTKLNIYITNDEDIKEGDYFIESLGLPDSYLVHKLSKEWKDKESFYRRCDKVILTTDSDLIKDGVQAIDDEFLEWFVKNPNCEEVEIENGWGLEIDIETPYYKLIIPKEEQTTEEQLPTKWFKTEEIDTWVGDSTDGGRGKLVVLHQCGENKEELISQLKTLINGIESDFEWFAQ